MEEYQVGINISLRGYTSSTQDYNIAESFALGSSKRFGLVPVIYEIHFSGKNGLFEMSSGYSAFQEEDEILIQDGLEYSVIDIQEIQKGRGSSSLAGNEAIK